MNDKNEVLNKAEELSYEELSRVKAWLAENRERYIFRYGGSLRNE